jgi:excisionase family DNA binding protein
LDIYTVEQVAEKLQIAVRTVYKLIKSGQLPASKVGSQYRISEEQLERFMKSQEVKPGQDNQED